MASKGVMFTPGAAHRVKQSVRKSEGAVCVQKPRTPGQVLGGGGSHWGKLDADLDYDESDGVTFSVWTYDDDTHAWEDSDDDIEDVFPPPEMKSGIIPKAANCAMLLKIEWLGTNWVITDYPKQFWGALSGDLVDDGTADVVVDDSTFVDVKAPSYNDDTIDDESEVAISLFSDGYWYVTLAPC